jgi:hypothetical protein
MLAMVGLLWRTKVRRSTVGVKLLRRGGQPHQAARRRPPRAQVHAAESGAWRFFEALSPLERKRYIAWIHLAKRPETRARRIRESVALLARGEKLGLK